MDLGLQITELAQFLGVTQDTIINWEIRGVKPGTTNLKKLEKFFKE